jgi:hypothetical protein
MSDHNKNIFDELKTLSPLLAEMPKVNPYSFPEDYFDNLTIDSAGKLFLTESGYQVPKGYFDQFPAIILQKLSLLAETETGLLPKSSNQTPPLFELPEGYFDSLPETILSSVSRKTSGQGPMTGRVFFMRYALAAAITGLLGLSLFTLMNPRQNDFEDMSSILSEAQQMIQSRSVDEAFNRLQEDEIIQFLEVNGHDIKTALVATAAYNAELPEEFEYLSDENTLDDFLHENDIEQTSN